MTIRDLEQSFAYIDERRRVIEKAEREIEREITMIKPQLVGRRVHCEKVGRLKGIYEIASVGYGYQGAVTARAWKILARGKRGHQTWDIGAVWFKRLLPQ